MNDGRSKKRQQTTLFSNRRDRRGPSDNTVFKRIIYTKPNQQNIMPDLDSSAVATKSALKPKEVSFSRVQIREYEQILGDHSGSLSAPLSLGWQFSEALETDIEEYEVGRQDLRRDPKSMWMPPNVVAERLMEHGYTRHELHQVNLKCRQQARKSRRRPDSEFQFRLASTKENVSRAVKRLLRPRKQEDLTWQRNVQFSSQETGTDNDALRGILKNPSALADKDVVLEGSDTEASDSVRSSFSL